MVPIWKKHQVNVLKSLKYCSVCACGQWVCTQNACEDDTDYELDEEDSPEDDPDVQDLRWF